MSQSDVLTAEEAETFLLTSTDFLPCVYACFKKAGEEFKDRVVSRHEVDRYAQAERNGVIQNLRFTLN